jgi:beta-phosphoglucomutase-like phosphatase (HAD superfamily)
LQEGLERCFRKLWHPKLDFTNEENTKDIFFLLDLDGTLVDSEKLHYQAYIRALKGLYALNWQPEKFSQQKFNDIINGEGMDAYIYDMCKSQTFLESTKQLKNIYLKNELTNLELMPGADALIDYIHTYNINHAVVTNTSKENVELFIKTQPKLQLLKNWITREDYTNPKPDGECFLLGLKKFHQGEPHVIGIENTISGHQSLLNATKCIYMMMDKNILQTSTAYSHAQKQDVYIIDDFNQLCK